MNQVYSHKKQRKEPEKRRAERIFKWEKKKVGKGRGWPDLGFSTWPGERAILLQIAVSIKIAVPTQRPSSHLSHGCFPSPKKQRKETGNVCPQKLRGRNNYWDYTAPLRARKYPLDPRDLQRLKNDGASIPIGLKSLEATCSPSGWVRKE